MWGSPAGGVNYLAARREMNESLVMERLIAPMLFRMLFQYLWAFKKLGRMISYHQSAASLFKEALSRLRAPARAAYTRPRKRRKGRTLPACKLVKLTANVEGQIATGKAPSLSDRVWLDIRTLMNFRRKGNQLLSAD